jgi:phytoene/squalene synthetase
VTVQVGEISAAAFQLTNFTGDVAEGLRRGRIHLPGVELPAPSSPPGIRAAIFAHHRTAARAARRGWQADIRRPGS